MTGDRFRDLKAGLKLACKHAGIEDVTWHIFRHTFASRLIPQWCGHHDREGAARAFDGDHEHAVLAYQP